MAIKKAKLVIFAYDDGSYDYAVGGHAGEVMDWLNGAQGMYAMHGAEYRGRPMIEISAPNTLESIASIAERTFPEWVEELRKEK